MRQIQERRRTKETICLYIYIYRERERFIYTYIVYIYAFFTPIKHAIQIRPKLDVCEEQRPHLKLTNHQLEGESYAYI